MKFFFPQWSDRQSKYLALASWSGAPISEAVYRARSADLIFAIAVRATAFMPTNEPRLSIEP